MSLMELIIYLAIVSIVLVVIIDLVTHLVYSQGKNSKNVEVQQNTNFIMDRLNSTISSASAANVTDNMLTLTVAGSPIIYSLNGNTLTIQRGAQPEQNLSNSKVQISAPLGGQLFEKITNTNVNTVKINLVVSLAAEANTKQQTTTTVMLRGK